MSYTTLIILEKYFFFLPRVSVTFIVIGSFSNYDDDDNDSVKKKTIGFMSKTNALHVHDAF